MIHHKGGWGAARKAHGTSLVRALPGSVATRGARARRRILATDAAHGRSVDRRRGCPASCGRGTCRWPAPRLLVFCSSSRAMYCQSVSEPSPQRLPAGASSRADSARTRLVFMPHCRQPACVEMILYVALTLPPRLACRKSRLESARVTAIGNTGSRCGDSVGHARRTDQVRLARSLSEREGGTIGLTGSRGILMEWNV